MPFRDLRQFLNKIEDDGELVRIPFEVDPKHEVGAVCRKALDVGGIENNKALLFEKPTGYDIPLAANVLTSRKRYYMALETSKEKIFRDWIDRTEHPVEPVIVSDGPCQENVLIGDDVDLCKFPIPIWNADDGGPYITMPCEISRDPVTGVRNAGMYRIMVHDRNHVGILAGAYRDVGAQWLKAYPKGEKVPIAIAIGLDPAIYAATIAPFPKGVDEMAMAGALRGEPVQLVKCRTIPLEAPACAEIVLEGEMLPEMREEGPFGEYTGYYGERLPRAVIRINAITHRNNPIYEGIYQGRPPTCDSVTQVIPHEIEIRRRVSLHGLIDINMCVGGAMFLAVASVRPQYEGQAKALGAAILATPSGRWIKTVILIDEELDPHNWTDVEWALGTRFQPDQDMDIIKRIAGIILDPSLPQEEKITGASRTSKVIIDATRPVHLPYPKPCVPKADVMAKVEAEWEKYGIS